MPLAFRLASADDPSLGRFLANLGDEGALAFGSIVLAKINDDPVSATEALRDLKTRSIRARERA